MKTIYITVLLISVNLAMFCSYYPLDPLACIQKTKGVACQFNFFENACLETKAIQLGCTSNLNEQACLQQQKKIDGSEVKCYFGKKCVEANEFHLRNLDCKDKLSIYACLNLYEKQCIWNVDKCLSYEEEIPLGDSCETIFNMPVSPRLCAQIQGITCFNNGFAGGYLCQEIQESQTETLTCDTLGLNMVGCTQIKKKGLKCIFKNEYCRKFKLEDQISCLQSINKEACLSITNPQVKCQWTNDGCQDYQYSENHDCEDIINVNPSVCRSLPEQCLYNETNSSCAKIETVDKISCDTKGLSITTCLSIKNDKCIYNSESGCMKLNQEDLNLINCQSQVNELACLSITTPSQNCKWTGTNCERIIINQDENCPLNQQPGIQFKVNGNVCSAISKYKVGCKYDKQSNLCQPSSNQETCTTPYLNLFACVQIQQVIPCKWNIENSNCENVKILDQITKCKDLLYANPIACSQITEIRNNLGIGCYYSDNTQQCTEIDDSSLRDMECLQKGLNKFGCTMISKLGQKCRWVRGQCTSIRSKEQIAQVSCLDLQFVNPGTCAMATFKNEVCKFKKEALGCVNTIDSSDTGDYCDTLGLNSIACQQITRNPTGCYFDKTNNICVTGPDSNSSNEVELAKSFQLLNTAKCTGNSPTRNICIAIQTLGQYCSWNSRNLSCENQYVQMNEKCLDYNTGEKQKTVTGAKVFINANVCASIIMNFPNYDPKSTNFLAPDDPLRGYCQYDGKGNCIKFQVKTCSDPCCGEIPGINAHVCSRYTSAYYCYFNEFNKCVQLTDEILDTSQEQAVKDFYNFKQYKCSSMNKNSCWMIEWSPTQQCYWDGNVCTQINYSNYPKFTLLVFPLNSLSKYACQGIEANDQNGRKYFKYFDQKLCDTTIIDQASCEVEGINSNICLGKTPKNYCKWDKVNLVCKTIDDYLQIYTCNEYQNKKACVDNPYSPCAFLDSSDKCITSPQNIECTDFNLLKPYYGWVNSKACANITKPGQICIFDDILNKCKSAVNITSQTCDLQGVNSIGCYNNTKGNCRWDQINLQCYEEGDQEIINNLKCNDNVNKKLCLEITIDNCEWSTVDMRCSSMEQLKTIDPTSYYNPQACTSLIGDAYYYDSNNGNGKCVKLTTSNNDCTSKILNKQACLLNTKGKKCFFDPTQLPEKKCQNFNEEQLTCSSPILINIEICMNIPQTCYFEEQNLTCKPILIQSTFKCSTLIVEGQHYNKLACSSISDQISDVSQDDTLKICIQKTPDSKQQCYFEKYCMWDDKQYACSLAKLGDAQYTSNQNGSSCSIPPEKFVCKNIYSRGLCLQFATGCYFDLKQGGCYPYTANLFKVNACSQINGDDCNLSQTENANCKQILAADGTDFTSNCDIEAPILNTCGVKDGVSNPLCLDLKDETSASTCASAADFCYLDSKCKPTQSVTGLTCSTPGLSKTLCLSLNPPCDFSSGKCTPLTIPSLNNDKSNYYYVCNEVNYLITYQGEYACSQITTTPCQFKLNSCQNAFYQECIEIQDLTVSLLACQQCKNLTTAYDYNQQKCLEILNLDSNCDTLIQQNCKAKDCQWNNTLNKCHINLSRLNKSSCLQLTLNIEAKWDETNDQCVLITSNEVAQIDDCSILSRKACLQTNPSCWIDQNTFQCQSFDSIMVDCADIDKLKGKKQHCMVSNKQACKWDTDKCVDADLLKDQCSNMNKYGCLNIKQPVNCGWSDLNKACTTITPNLSIGCIYYVWGSQFYYYNQVNPYVCSQLSGVNNSCYYDQRTKKCTAVGTFQLYCSKHLGINKLACLRSTLDKCKFDSTNFTCVPITDKDTTCDPSLNQVACLSQPNAYCQFYLNECDDYYLIDKVTVDIASIPLIAGKVISPRVCQYYNQKISKAYFIYDPVRKSCVNTDRNWPSQFFALCNSISISKQVCLEKTMEFCSYENDQCQSIGIETIRKQTACNTAYSWKACIAISALCKFQNGLCIPIASTDTCLSISLASDTYVGPQVCSQFPTPCKYSQKNYNCQVVLLPTETCSSPGLSKIACLEFTKASFCLYDAINNKCVATYDNTLPCSDTNNPKGWYVNKAKCFFIKAPGNYCQFQDGECINVSEDNLQKCNYPIKETNPISCQKANNGVCYYSNLLNTCFLGDLILLKLVPWSLGKSFNRQACIGYDPLGLVDQVSLIWDDINGCTELSKNDLANIQCNSPINRIACVSITNPTQFCQFDTDAKQCISYDYTIPPLTKDKTCIQLKNVNRFEFCQYASDDCMYNQIERNCIIPVLATLQPTIQTTADCFGKGFSESLCTITNLTHCKYSTDRKLCYGGSIFCTDNSVNSCSDVISEPCWIKNNKCVGISFDDLEIISCSDATNMIGCTSISTPSKLCQYDRSTKTCKDLTILTNDCVTYTNVNNNKACEQTTDIACKFDFISKSCKEVAFNDQFECDRGLNLLACTNYTRKSLQCQFKKYCIGPTYGVNQCSDAINKEVCLNYEYECTWNQDLNQCINFDSSTYTCQQLQDNKTIVSSQVCYKSKIDQGACIFDAFTYNCKVIIPTTCIELETQEQCRQMNDLSCYWANEKCNLLEIKDSDTCQYIGLNGSKKACLSIFRQGQKCQYLNNQCITFQEQYDNDNCLDNINKIACITQQSSLCEWKIEIDQIASIQNERCNVYIQNKMQGCNQLLSYKACFTIQKKGQFCRWLNGQCSNIQPILNQKIYFNTYQLVNENSCGLVNVGKIKYNEQNYSCIPINDNEIITCKCGFETKGLNKIACLSIINEPCLWNDSYKICIEYGSKCDIY